MDVIGLLGMPGAGKTTAMKSLTSRVDKNFQSLKMKDVAGEQYWGVHEDGLDYFPEEMRFTIQDEELENQVVPTGDIGSEIGDWVDSVLSVNNNYFAEKAASQIQNMTKSDVVVVDGIRSVPDVKYINEIANTFKLVFIQTPFSTRLDRLQNRGRDGEEDVGADYLIKRDKQELSWGVDEILSSYKLDKNGYNREYPVYTFYSNHDSVGHFESDFSFFINDLIEV